MSMRAGPASRDANFRGIDTEALSHLIQQLRTASSAIDSWLAAHPPPPGVSSPGYKQAASVQLWITEQLGMLTRRRNFALANQDKADIDAVTPPDITLTAKYAPPANQPKPRPTVQPIVQAGAGTEIGQFPSTQAATKAAATDALATKTATQDHKPVPNDVWKNLTANAKDPDYTAAFYQRLGPEGTARLIDAAEGDKAKLKAISQSLTTAQHEHRMNSQWVSAILIEADKLGNREQVLQVLSATPLQPKLDDQISYINASLTSTARAS